MASNLLSAYDLKKGKTTKNSPFATTMWQPLQMLPEKEKTPEWFTWNMDFLEWQSMRQILRNRDKFIANYKIANGEIDKRDYIRESMDQEYIELADKLNVTELAATELMYYSLTDKVVDFMVNNFSERVSLLSFEMRDQVSFNEISELKKEEMNNYLLEDARMKQQIKMIQLGIEEDSEEGQQMLSPEGLRSLPQIQDFYSKNYKSIYQQWAWDTMQEDISRFSMTDLEIMNFRHSLITDREYWHFRMMDNDYSVEIWNPMLVAYQKSPHAKYMSEASWIVHSTEMTVPDVIDMYGWQMTLEQLENLSHVYPMTGTGFGYLATGRQNDGSFYDSSKSREWNQQGPGIAMRQYLTARGTDPVAGFNGNVVRNILFEGEDLVDYGDVNLVRVSTIYWTSQRMIYHLTKVDEFGRRVENIVGENYKVTTKPVYNTEVYKEKSARSLIYGEHLEAEWINEKLGGIKIGPNLPSWAGMSSSTGIQPMYIGWNDKKPGRLPFQFKGDGKITGSKLPVEGCVFTDLTGNARSRSVVDKMKPWQIPFNIVNNMIRDKTVDEIGKFMAFNPDTLPKDSLGEDWKNGNYAKVLNAMRMGALPLNRSIQNTEGVPDNRPIEMVDLTQNTLISSLIERAEYFKRGALNAVGLNDQIFSTPISQQQTATEVKQGVASGYAQIEHYFSHHSDMLMPRVHQMRTELAQYYNCTNPSIRIQYTTSDNARIWHTVNGLELLGRDFGVRCLSRSNTRAMVEKIRNYLLSNNTLTDYMPDQVRAIKAQTLYEMDDLMNDIEQRHQQEEQQRMQVEQQQHDSQLQMQMQLLQEKQAFEAEQKQLDREEKRYEAELNAASRAATANTPDEGVNAYDKQLDRIDEQNSFREKMNFEHQKHIAKTQQEQQKINLRQEELQAENTRSKAMVKVARINDKVKEKNKSQSKKK